MQLLRAFRRAKEGNGRLHFLGLVSDGGVHSHIKHLEALMQAAAVHYGVPSCFVHAFTDGRDTAPRSGAGYMEELQRFIDKVRLVRKSFFLFLFHLQHGNIQGHSRLRLAGYTQPKPTRPSVWQRRPAR